MTSASTTVIALLRGINVGGHNKLPMAQLRDIAAEVGFIDVRTYIQSGNLVASTDLEPEVAGEVLALAIRETTGLRTSIIVRTAQQWAAVIAANPFPDVLDQGTRVHVIFLPVPASAAIQAFDASGFSPDSLAVVGSEIYLHLPDGMGRSRLAVAVNRLPVVAAGTARNWNTVLRIAALAHIGLRLGPVELEVDGSDLRVRPIAGDSVAEDDGWLVVPASGTTMTDDEVRALRDGDQR